MKTSATLVLVSGIHIAADQDVARRHLAKELTPLLGEIKIDFLLRQIKPHTEVVIGATATPDKEQLVRDKVTEAIGNYGRFSVVFDPKAHVPSPPRTAVEQRVPLG